MATGGRLVEWENDPRILQIARLRPLLKHCSVKNYFGNHQSQRLSGKGVPQPLRGFPDSLLPHYASAGPVLHEKSPSFACRGPPGSSREKLSLRPEGIPVSNEGPSPGRARRRKRTDGST